jgi:hypothetical protein
LNSTTEQPLPGTGAGYLPISSDAERHRAWPLHDGLGAVSVRFDLLVELLADVGATSVYLDPDADATVTIDAAALLEFHAN